MDKLIPYLRETPVSIEEVPVISDWYVTETSRISDSAQLPYLLAQGWRVISQDYRTDGTVTAYNLWRRVLKPEKALQSLVASYTKAYNEGRELNDQRYDDLIVLYTSLLDKSEDYFTGRETSDTAYSNLAEYMINVIQADYNNYAADVRGDLDDFGNSLRTNVNQRFDNQLSNLRQDLISRGMYNSTVWTSVSSGVEKERAIALTDLEDKISEKQLNLKHTLYSRLADLQSKILAARDRLRDSLLGTTDKHLASRNAIAEALARFVEARTDSYPDLGEIGKIAAALGAGSPEAFQP